MLAWAGKDMLLVIEGSSGRISGNRAGGYLVIDPALLGTTDGLRHAKTLVPRVRWAKPRLDAAAAYIPNLCGLTILRVRTLRTISTTIVTVAGA